MLNLEKKLVFYVCVFLFWYMGFCVLRMVYFLLMVFKLIDRILKYILFGFRYLFYIEYKWYEKI